jgi:putative selenium metabolism hydrolase
MGNDQDLYGKVAEAARAAEKRIVAFLRDLVRIPGTSGTEERVADRILAELRDAGYDRAERDSMGNVLGWIEPSEPARGDPRTVPILAFDAHIDTVGVGNRDLWTVDPFEGAEDAESVWGRGASDQKGGLAAMVYAGSIARALRLNRETRVLVVGSVQEEDCEGLCWQHIIEREGIRPRMVVSTEPSSCTITRGQRGRMEIRVRTLGRSCHGSAPERGDNAIFKMAPILIELQGLAGRLASHAVLGKATLTVSEVFFTSPSRCAVADSCSVSIDRRLTLGETAESALAEVRGLPSVRASGAEVAMYRYETPSYTGSVFPTDAYFPPWLLEEDDDAVQLLVAAHRAVFAREPQVGTWTFSTNGVSITGRYGIPTVGYGPGHEDQAHAPDERTWKRELVDACALYAATIARASESWRNA